jgi:hypothetical protein
MDLCLSQLIRILSVLRKRLEGSYIVQQAFELWNGAKQNVQYLHKWGSPPGACLLAPMEVGVTQHGTHASHR